MPPFLRWCAVFLGLYAGLALAYHHTLTHTPRRVVVALDASYPMQAVWDQVPPVLETLQARRYTVFSLLTEKATLHSWQPTLTLGRLQPYAPRTLAPLLDVAMHQELRAADEVVVVTNAANTTALPVAKHWRVVQLQPVAP